jgi:hypothetical protein
VTKTPPEQTSLTKPEKSLVVVAAATHDGKVREFDDAHSHLMDLHSPSVRGNTSDNDIEIAGWQMGKHWARQKEGRGLRRTADQRSGSGSQKASLCPFAFALASNDAASEERPARVCPRHRAPTLRQHPGLSLVAGLRVEKQVDHY